MQITVPSTPVCNEQDEFIGPSLGLVTTSGLKWPEVRTQFSTLIPSLLRASFSLQASCTALALALALALAFSLVFPGITEQ